MQSLQGLKSGEYRGAKKLKLCCGLSGFPKEIFDLSDSLEILDLSGNPLSELPEDFSSLRNLKVAFFSDCKFKIFPNLSQCPVLEMVAFRGNEMARIPEDVLPPKLRWLILTNNAIKELPESIGNCDRLQKCMLAGNQLTELPGGMANCRKLGLLRLSANRFTTLPDWLFNLPELSFLSFAGNPGTPSSADNAILKEITWADVSIQELLGQGASGIISKGSWKAGEANKEVAVKLFNGDVTSDGRPIDEMNACIAAGQHPNLINPLGKIHGHPEKAGLVLQLVPQNYKNLGLPPSFESCTRDEFHPETVLSFEKCKTILRSIAAAAAHIHTKGILHGDLYAHNILTDHTGNSLLGDFGAATLHGQEQENAQAFERLEVLAFGHLIEDMIRLVNRPVDGSILGEKEAFEIDILNELHGRCTRPVPSERPLLKEINDVLMNL
ncbi:hypothetical protein B7463_g2551, partial [Scytalidium lignicola]